MPLEERDLRMPKTKHKVKERVIKVSLKAVKFVSSQLEKLSTNGKRSALLLLSIRVGFWQRFNDVKKSLLKSIEIYGTSLLTCLRHIKCYTRMR